MAFFNPKLLLKLRYSRNKTTLKSPYLLPTKVTISYFDEKPHCQPNLALKKWQKWIFGQNWTYLIWLNMVWDSHSTHNQYLISRFLGEFRVLKNYFQPGVFRHLNSNDPPCHQNQGPCPSLQTFPLCRYSILVEQYLSRFFLPSHNGSNS